MHERREKERENADRIDVGDGAGLGTTLRIVVLLGAVHAE